MAADNRRAELETWAHELRGVPPPLDRGRDAFWAEQAALIDWQRPFQQVLDYGRPPFARWFVGGETNLCHNAVDRHLAARGGQRGR